MPFINPLALLGLLSVVPLIILYMIRAKPMDLPFPSIHFIVKDEARPSVAIRRFITDPLFWIQLLAICLLVVSAAGPFVVAEGTRGSHLVVVMDVSASMETSFEEAANIASRYISEHDRISIVLAENVPLMALSEGSLAEAGTVLAGISPRAVPADLSGGMILAKSLLGADGGQILVVSDFLSWVGDDPETTRGLIEDKGTQVVFADSDGGGENVAMVSGWIEESGVGIKYEGLIRNFGNTRRVPIEISGPGGSIASSATIESGSDHYLSFEASPGINILSLNVEDAIFADNKVYIYAPEHNPRRVLYQGEVGPALAALESLPNVDVSRSGDYDNFDLVVTTNATADGKLNRYVHRGGRVIYLAINPSFSPEYLPVRVEGVINGTALLWVRSPVFTEGIHFDEIGVYGSPDARPRSRSVTMVEANGVPVLSYWKLGSGTVIYLGLVPGLSDFHERPEYPIFWYKTVNWLTDVPDASEANMRTGEIIRLGETTTVETPEGIITTKNLLLDMVGVYKFQGQTVVANMYDPRESDLSDGESFTTGTFTTRTVSEKLIEKDLSPWLILMAAAMIALELVIIKRRGEA